MTKLITVFGASEIQGGSVVRALLQTGKFNVRAVRSDRDNCGTQELMNIDTEVVSADYTNFESINKALAGAYGCFVVTDTNFTDPDSIDTELRQGKLIADACVQSCVSHVVFSTQLNSQRIIGSVARHLVAKAKIEEYIKEKCLPLTSIIVPVCYEDVLNLFTLQTMDKMNYDLVTPMGTTPLDIICGEDIGKVVNVVFSDKQNFIGKTLSISGDKLTMKKLAAILSHYLKPKSFRHKQITISEYHQLNKTPASHDLANMFDFFLRVDQRYNISATKRLCPDLQSFEDWVKTNHKYITTRFF